jgi:hypothetical protein
MMGHDFVADFVLGPAFKITRVDAEQLAERWCNWRQYYPDVVDSKSAALVMLLITAAIIELPRITVVMAQRRAATAAKAAQAQAAKGQGGKIVQMPDFKGV